MKNSERDEEAFEEKPRPKRPVQDEDEPPRRKAPPPVDEGHIEEGERPRPRSRQEDAEDEADAPRRRPRSRYEEEDDEDDRSRRRPRGRDEPYSAMIPYRNVTALNGYYCGMISLIAILGGIALIFYKEINPQFNTGMIFLVVMGLGGILALQAVILGIKGIGYANKNPKARGMGHAIAGIVLGILEILGLLTILVLGIMATQRF
jgi:hypothetical protein